MQLRRVGEGDPSRPFSIAAAAAAVTITAPSAKNASFSYDSSTKASSTRRPYRRARVLP
ncbi:hypothetical protein [Cellulomonas hominis]|uniref:hypothetical protein n=1 Tax=Cellulomonas hominis TaxID=156981 RepID=UPI001BD08BBF